MDFLIGFSSGFLMFTVILYFFIKLLVKAINKKDQLVYRLYHEGQLPIMMRIEGLALIVQMNEKNKSEEIKLLIQEIKLLKHNIKETLRKIE